MRHLPETLTPRLISKNAGVVCKLCGSTECIWKVHYPEYTYQDLCITCQGLSFELIAHGVAEHNDCPGEKRRIEWVPKIRNAWKYMETAMWAH